MRRKKGTDRVFFAVVMSVFLLFILGIAGESAFAQELMVFPAKGQTKDQQEKDEFDCYRWAKDQSGFDPMEVPKATAPPPQEEAKQGGVARGAARGAVTGLAVGAIAGDAGKGAAIGAAGGGLIGGARRRDQKAREEKKQEQWAQNQAANYQQNRNNYNRAYSACLEGKGYTVK
jgi:hypothetical protein